MRLFDENQKGRFDLYDLEKLENICNLGLCSHDEEWDLVCPAASRSERTSYFGTNSSGEVCFIDIQWAPIDEQRTRATVTLSFKIKGQNVFRAVEEQVLHLDEIRDSFGRLSKIKIGAFLIEFRRPLVSVRFVFNGFLQDINTKAKRFARINLFSMGLSQVFDNLSSFDVSFRTQQSQDEKIFCEDSFEQWVQLKARIEFEDVSEPQELWFWGMNLKSFEQESIHVNHLVGINHKGMGFHLAEVESSSSNHFYGHVNMGFGNVFPLQEIPQGIEKLNAVQDIQQLKFMINLIKEKRVYNVQLGEDAFQLDQNIWVLPLKIRNYDGYGLFWKQSVIAQTQIKADPHIDRPLKNDSKDAPENLVLSLSDEFAELESLTGGKGSSLAVLRKFSQKSVQKFQVPEAVIVTSEAYKLFLSSNPDLKKEVENFTKRVLACGGVTEKIREECYAIQDKFYSTPMPETLVNSLKKKMNQIFDSSLNDGSFAVRSSAVGEDTAEMSAAGQMVTLLGVKGFDDICESIVGCWASQFSLTAVEYKRGYGQSIHSPMAVVVQQMVECDVAGVMFTCDPLTGNPRYLSITGNFGLGDSVVSGLADPDEFKVQLDVDSKPLTVRDVTDIRVGDKKIKVSVGGKRVQHLEVIDSIRATRCLNDEQVLELARIGLAVQQHYGNARDIEWGIKDGHWFLFQSRPVTSFESLTEWEIMHELDTGHNSENELLSRSNLGEVFPGASSYVVYNFILRVWNSMTYTKFRDLLGLKTSDYNPYTHLGFQSAYNTIFFNGIAPHATMGKKRFNPDDKFSEAFRMAMSFKDLDQEKIFADVLERLPEKNMTFLRTIKMITSIPDIFLKAHSLNKKSIRQFGTFSLDQDIANAKSSAELHSLLGKIHLVEDALMNNARCSMQSGFYGSLLYYFLATKMQIKEKQEVLDLYSRISASAGEVFSAQVPMLLQKIAAEINNPEFSSLSDTDALEYLECNHESFNQLLQTYGHRGYKEFDLYSKPWGKNPLPLVQSLKSMCTHSKAESEENNQGYDLEKYRLGWTKRKILHNYIIPRAHRGIRDRELAKNLMIRTYNEFRKVYYALGERLVEDGKIPQCELVFFMTFTELQEIVEFPVSNCLTVINAKNRLRLHSKKDALKFNEITWGYETRPRNFEPKPDIPVGAIQLKGVPISCGKVVARCFVAETLEDAKHIQKGDILITFSTDIGWSPYFAALSGLITEIGGLISHGAVIAREYGLPCLVGVDNATLFFTTGDTLLLDTANGTVAKLEKGCSLVATKNVTEDDL